MFDVVCTTVNGGIPIFYRKNSKSDSVSKLSSQLSLFKTEFIICNTVCNSIRRMFHINLNDKYVYQKSTKCKKKIMSTILNKTL